MPVKFQEEITDRNPPKEKNPGAKCTGVGWVKGLSAVSGSDFLAGKTEHDVGHENDTGKFTPEGHDISPVS
ncbi:hypothetical protein [Acidithiobacillus ferrooxidans]|uniref:hypothetical protein n=1 Tax=Acidithiobacillus ferrooxidans TaxID=920 RepID=UPI001C074AA1|nr:hypothetical protein [Acidithiobacillus ferrooxidans]